METRKIINLINDSKNEESKFATKEQYVILSQKAKKIKNTIKTILLNLRMKVLIQALILITGDITVTADNNTDVASKNCASFSTCKRN